MVLEVLDNVKVAGFLTSEIGSIVRFHAPVCHMGWRDVPLEDKRHLKGKLLVLFEVDLTNPKILKYVDLKMTKLYSVFKWRLHQHYVACGTPREGRANPPLFDLWNGRPKQHWQWLCDKVKTAKDFLELSETNVKNRKQLKFYHKGGARPFIQHAKNAAKNGTQLSVIDNWKALHKDKNNQWVHDVAREKYDEMKQRRDERREKLIIEAPEDIPHDSVHVPLRDELEIMTDTLGRKGKSIRDVGSFPRMETTTSFTSSSAVSKSELAEIHDQLKLIATNFIEMQKENEQLKVQVRALSTSQGQTSNISGNACSGQDKNDADDDYDELADYDGVDD